MMTFVLLTVISCQKSDRLSNVSETSNPALIKKEKTFYLYYATWDKFGRASRDCDGWGLCNFLDCGFCCVDPHGVIVDCNIDSPIPNSGVITIDSASNVGIMVFELDPNDTEHNLAILDQDTLFVDQDISSDYSGVTITIEAGQYLFDTGIGQDGGYTLNVSRAD